MQGSPFCQFSLSWLQRNEHSHDLNSTARQSLDIPPPMFDISTIPNLTSDTDMSRGGDETGAVVLEDM